MRNSLESEIERGAGGKKRARKSKEQDSDERRSQLDEVKKLTREIELMLRSLENEAVSPDRLNEVREPFENFLQDLNGDYARSVWEGVLHCPLMRPA